jgi:hypothetical protein
MLFFVAVLPAQKTKVAENGIFVVFFSHPEGQIRTLQKGTKMCYRYNLLQLYDP